MVMALLLVGVMLIVAVMLLGNTSSAAVNTSAFGEKEQLIDAAQAGLDSAVDVVDNVLGGTTCASGAVNGYQYTCGILNNLTGLTSVSVGDPATGKLVTIPVGMALVWGKATNASGQRATYAEAIVTVPSTSITFPNYAVATHGNISGGGHMTVKADPTDILNPHDANIFADGNISSFTTLVNGITYAAGTDSQQGSDGQVHSSQTPISFATASQVSSFQNQAIATAQKGTQMSAATFLSNGTRAYAGNVYINGNVDMTSGTATFTGAGTVYVNGYLCLSGHASIVNASGSLVVVAQQFSQAGNATGYTVTAGTKPVLAVLGNNTQPACSAANGAYAANVSGNGTQQMGTVWAPNGSVQLAGNGSIIGAVVAGGDAVFNGGGSGGYFQYDHDLLNTAISLPSNIKIVSYAEY